MIDVRVADGGTLHWSLATQALASSSDFGIATRTITLADPWIVYVDGIQKDGGLHNNALGPARADLDLGPVRIGDQRFRIVAPEGIGQGTLHVTADSIFIDYAGPVL